MAALLRVARTVDFDRLYRRHAASVYRYAFAVLGNQADAEDVTQQTFLNAYRAIAQGTKPRKPENWLMRIAHNEVRRHFRSVQGKAFEVELDDRLAQNVPERSDPSLADVLRALQHLPPAQRSALLMREFEGRSYAEIAEIMNITQSALEGQLFRARRALAEHFEEALTCAEAEEAVLRRLDGRLPRRVGRRLKAHLHGCQVCVRFADVQKRQRALLKGLSVMPIPASIFLFRGEQAAAGLGASAVAAGGSGAVGGGAATAAGAGGTGIAAGFAAKAAALTAAAVTAGGVGYGVATKPDLVTRSEQTAPQTAIAHETPRSARVAQIAATSVPVDRPAPGQPRSGRPTRKAGKAKAKELPARPMPPAKASVRAERAAAKLARASEPATPTVKAPPTEKPKPAAPKARTRP
ncbi:MAG TPA: sigma-70 family RNA polymerase sigma factor, partial [Gaiellaceae bacterium]|nr:sigma-70 family RNA polymerase sigma factor [Gaiellaceae bacterium]